MPSPRKKSVCNKPVEPSPTRWRSAAVPILTSLPPTMSGWLFILYTLPVSGMLFANEHNAGCTIIFEHSPPAASEGRRVLHRHGRLHTPALFLGPARRPLLMPRRAEQFRRGIMRSHLRRSMARDIVKTSNAPAPPPTYSQAVRAAGLVFVSGTGPHDPATGKIAGDTIQEQTRQCLKNISAVLEAAGTSLDRVVSATVIILEESDFAGMNEEWVKWFPTNPPARQGAKLPVRIPGMKVSIAVIAEA
jgi:2-iminobutanoate/2-iminopropanoate deaminase